MNKDWVNGTVHSLVCQILSQIVVRAVITSSPSPWTSSAGMLFTPADFALFSDCTAASTSLRRMGWSSSVSIWGQFGTDGSLLALCSSEQYSIRQFSTSRSSVRHFFSKIFDSSGFSLLHSGQVFSQVDMHSYCCSCSDFLQSHYTVLLSNFLLPFARTS